MRRLYVLPKSVWSGKVQIGSGTLADGAQQPVMIETVRLFHPAIGSHYLELPGGFVLLMTSLDHDERAEDLFHGHPEVTILPHPTADGNLPLKSHIGRPGYKFTQAHLDALQAHDGMGITETDSVLEIFKKAGAIHPLIKLRNML
jgi:hypothetical protein